MNSNKSYACYNLCLINQLSMHVLHKVLRSDPKSSLARQNGKNFGNGKEIARSQLVHAQIVLPRINYCCLYTPSTLLVKRFQIR